jgi:hypothetical protein
MDRKVEIAIEGKVSLGVDEAAVERAKARAAEVERAAREAAEAFAQVGRVAFTPTPLEAAYARALGADHPLYRRVTRGLEGLEAQLAGARTPGDFARLEARTAVLERYLEQALAVGADPKVAERLREELARLREEIARDREERARGRLMGGEARAVLPGAAPREAGRGGMRGARGEAAPLAALAPWPGPPATSSAGPPRGGWPASGPWGPSSPAWALGAWP